MNSPTPNILSYCATFLPKEMLHVYRQVSGIRLYTNWVVTRTRANAEAFPFPRVEVLQKSPWRFLNRIYHRSSGSPVPVSGFEIRQMLRLASRLQCRLAHIYLGTEALRVLPFFKGFPGARIVSFHGADLADQFDASMYQSLWTYVDFVLCRSESLRVLLLAKGCPADRIRLNFTGVPVPIQISPKTLPDWRTGETVRLLQACRFIPKKGLDLTLKTVARLKQRGIPIKLTLAGDGPELKNLKVLAGQLGIAGEVDFCGFVSTETLERLFTEHHIFMHPSRVTTKGDREGIPNALLEAMSFGLPVISTRHSGIPEAVTNGETGLLVEKNEEGALAEAVLTLLQNKMQFGRLSETARRHILEKFSMERCVSQLEEIYAEALATHPAASNATQTT